MKKKIGTIEYNIIPIPPYLSPYSTRAGQLMKQQPASFEEAEKLGQEIKKCVEKLVNECVNPEPEKEDMLRVYNALIDVTNKAIKDAQFFRDIQRSGTAKSSAVSSGPTQTAKRDPEAKG